MFSVNSPASIKRLFYQAKKELDILYLYGASLIENNIVYNLVAAGERRSRYSLRRDNAFIDYLFIGLYLFIEVVLPNL